MRVRGWVGGERRSCLYRPVGSRGLRVMDYTSCDGEPDAAGTREVALTPGCSDRQANLRDDVAGRVGGQHARVPCRSCTPAARPLTLVASAITTAQPCSSSRSYTNRAPFIDSMTPHGRPAATSRGP